jgi:hypothetical protein
MEPKVRDGRNLVRIAQDGSVIWRACPPFLGSGEDCFVQFQCDGLALTAHTWSCYRVGIDIRDGTVTVLEFTK